MRDLSFHDSTSPVNLTWFGFRLNFQLIIAYLAVSSTERMPLTLLRGHCQGRNVVLGLKTLLLREAPTVFMPPLGRGTIQNDQKIANGERLEAYWRLAALALASAIFDCISATKTSAPAIGMAKGSSGPDLPRGVRITASPLESTWTFMP